MSFSEAAEAVQFISEGEDAFDAAILDESPTEAKAIAKKYLDQVMPLTSQGLYPNGLSRLALKEIAGPFYERAVHDAHHTEYDPAALGVQDVFYNSAQFLDYINNWRQEVYEGANGTHNPLLSKLGYDVSQFTMFSLFSLGIEGSSEDRLTILPSTRAQAKFDRNAAKAAWFGFVIRERAGEERAIKVAVDRVAEQPHYEPDISVIDIESVFNGRPYWLTNSLIEIAQGTAGHRSRENATTAMPRLHRLVSAQMQKSGRTTTTATNT